MAFNIFWYSLVVVLFKYKCSLRSNGIPQSFLDERVRLSVGLTHNVTTQSLWKSARLSKLIALPIDVKQSQYTPRYRQRESQLLHPLVVPSYPTTSYFGCPCPPVSTASASSKILRATFARINIFKASPTSSNTSFATPIHSWNVTISIPNFFPPSFTKA